MRNREIANVQKGEPARFGSLTDDSNGKVEEGLAGGVRRIGVGERLGGWKAWARRETDDDERMGSAEEWTRRRRRNKQACICRSKMQGELVGRVSDIREESKCNY